jgi:hypothetical protein
MTRSSVATLVTTWAVSACGAVVVVVAVGIVEDAVVIG